MDRKSYLQNMCILRNKAFLANHTIKVYCVPTNFIFVFNSKHVDVICVISSNLPDPLHRFYSWPKLLCLSHLTNTEKYTKFQCTLWKAQIDLGSKFCIFVLSKDILWCYKYSNCLEFIHLMSIRDQTWDFLTKILHQNLP